MTLLTPLRQALSEVPDTLRLAVPIIVGLSAAMLIGVVDTIMIAPLGTTALAAVGLASAALVILYSALYGLVSVVGIEIARRYGTGRSDDVASSLRNGTVLGLVAGSLAAVGMMVAFPLLRYLDQPPEVLPVLWPYWVTMAMVLIPFSMLYVFKGFYDAIGRPWVGAGFAMLSVLVNIPLNWLLIHGVGGWQGLGLMGAGIASFLSECTALLAAWAFWRYRNTMAEFRGAAAISIRDMSRQLHDGGPIALAYTGEGASYSFVGIMLGWLGVVALAANQIVGSISTVIYMLPLGMSAAVGIRISLAMGAGQVERVRSIGIGAIAAVVVWMLFITLLLIAFRDNIARGLSADPAVITVASTMFLSVALMQVFDGVQSTALGALRGLMDNRAPSIISLIAYWPVALPAAYLFGFVLDLGPSGIWIGYGIGLSVAAFALLFRFYRKSQLSSEDI
ncbi:MATE family efflux transporter [Parasulfitobacter algicola]|uniref:Multidrug-efflux transporter n=1 Tax=Parasulfitobacter algicola TaxID=2614809 RepID=A0ABX2INW9_9RHOB|nr:MATE family efflux transporter [Sulfitobacter algicola]NSX54558.1 MATE family efflux transporter [Sulfitobacter algicola]